MRRARRLIGPLTAAVVLSSLCSVAHASVPGTVSGAASGVASGVASAKTGIRPVIFVHGGSGSGSQFQTQAKRFASNGYPATWVEAHDYDSLFLTNTMEQVHAALDKRIARLKAATGAKQVELLGHSLGTRVSQLYLKSSPERAASVAHYVNIDGGSTAGADAPPVPTLAIWGEGSPTRKIEGATNIYHPDESHVQTTSSVSTFEASYEFFTGKKPATTDVVPQRGKIKLAGRAVYFPINIGLQNARLAVFPYDPKTGKRLTKKPVASYELGGDGSFGPFTASGTASYEFFITKHNSNQVHHLYYPPFRRTDLGIRVLSTEPGSPVDWLIERNPRHVALLAYRDKEWWGDQGANSDVLTINGTSVLNATITPRTKRANGIFFYDWHSDRTTKLDQTVGVFPVLPFISGGDLYMPAAGSPSGPSGTVTLETRQRAGNGRTVRVVIPAWPSDTHAVTVKFDDYV